MFVVCGTFCLNRNVGPVDFGFEIRNTSDVTNGRIDSDESIVEFRRSSKKDAR